MAEVTFRVGLGRPLTYQEADDNFRFVEEQAVNAATAAAASSDFSQSAASASQTAQSARDTAQAASTSASASAATAELAKNASEDARDDAMTAAGAIGPIKFFDTYADAVAGIGTIPEGWQAQVLNDETRGGSRTQYKPIAGVLQFTVDLDLLRSNLSSPGGASLVDWSQGFSGSKVRTVESKLRDIVSANDLAGFDPSGETDSSPAVNAAFSAFPGGISIFIVHGSAPLFDTDINPDGIDNCAIIGQKGALGRTFASPNLNLYTPRVSLNRSATINLSNSCSVIDLPIFAKNLQFSSTRAVVDAWTGTAITLLNDKSDQLVRDCLILGFEFGVRTEPGAERSDRSQVEGCNFDCLNAIYIENSSDVPKIRDCHGWPWVTLGSQPEQNDAHLKRPGAFVWLVSVGSSPNDWGKVSDCFLFGWKTGFRISGADAVTLLSCSADNPPGSLDDSVGFVIEGGAIEIRLIGCQSAGRQKGYYIATTDPNGRVYLTACNSWETTQYAMHIVNGDVNAVNCGFRNTDGESIGVYAENTITKVRLGFTKFNGFLIGVHTESNAAKVFVDGSCDFAACATDIDNPYFANITPSADVLPLDGDSTFFGVSGDSTFKTFAKANRYAGRVITTRFFSSLNIGTGGNTSLTSPLTVSAGQSLAWACDGVNFHKLN